MAANRFDSEFDFDNDPVFAQFRSKEPEPKQDDDFDFSEYAEFSDHKPATPAIDNADLDAAPTEFDLDAFLEGDDYLKQPAAETEDYRYFLEDSQQADTQKELQLFADRSTDRRTEDYGAVEDVDDETESYTDETVSDTDNGKDYNDYGDYDSPAEDEDTVSEAETGPNEFTVEWLERPSSDYYAPYSSRLKKREEPVEDDEPEEQFRDRPFTRPAYDEEDEEPLEEYEKTQPVSRTERSYHAPAAPDFTLEEDNDDDLYEDGDNDTFVDEPLEEESDRRLVPPKSDDDSEAEEIEESEEAEESKKRGALAAAGGVLAAAGGLFAFLKPKKKERRRPKPMHLDDDAEPESEEAPSEPPKAADTSVRPETSEALRMFAEKQAAAETPEAQNTPAADSFQLFAQTPQAPEQKPMTFDEAAFEKPSEAPEAPEYKEAPEVPEYPEAPEAPTEEIPEISGAAAADAVMHGIPEAIDLGTGNGQTEDGEVEFLTRDRRRRREETPERRRHARSEVQPEEERPQEEQNAQRKDKKKAVKLGKLPKLPQLPKIGKVDLSKLPKVKKPAFIDKLLMLYFAPVLDKKLRQDMINIDPKTRQPRRKRFSRMQIIKEIYLPPIILCVAILMILSIVIGSVTNAFHTKKVNARNAKIQAQQASIAADAARAAFDESMLAVDELTKKYDFDNAIKLLDQLVLTNPDFQSEIVNKKSELMNLKATMVKWDDLSTIPNLSFHVLIAEPERAFSDKSLGGQYNRNFVTVDEFRRILEELYANNYILVDFNNLVTVNSGADGKSSYFAADLYLPQGKKPIMLTETMVNYFEYMVDSNKDHEPDAGGAGFACKLVIDNNDDIKAMLVDANSQSKIGDYDFVPVLETFIAEHPDFSYCGARATLAVTGEQGIFGYRTNTSYIASKGQSYYDKEVADAKQVVQALKDKGYTLACFTYSNGNYRTMTVQQIQADLQSWTNQIVPVMGSTDVLVYAKEVDIDDYTGNKFTMLYNAGFRFFITNGESPSLEIKETYVRMKRLMVSGNAMGWYASRFTNYFDCNKVLDVANRGNIPN